MNILGKELLCITELLATHAKMHAIALTWPEWDLQVEYDPELNGAVRVLYRTGKSCLHPKLGRVTLEIATQRHEPHSDGVVHALQGSSGGKADGFSDFC